MTQGRAGRCEAGGGTPESPGALEQEANLTTPLPGTEIQFYLVLMGNGDPEKPKQLPEARNWRARLAAHILSFTALHSMIYHVVEKKTNNTQVKEEITG